MKHLALALLVLLAGCEAAPVPATPNEVASNWDLVLDSTVALVDVDNRAYCSGVWHKNFILTAAHCVEGAESGYYSSHNKYTYDNNQFTESFAFNVRARDEGQDVALLDPVGQTPEHINLTLYAGQPYYGQHVFAIGHPYGIGYTICEGRVVAPTRMLDNWKVTHTTCEVRPGMSGGPLLSEDSEILGINAFYWLASEISLHSHIDSVKQIAQEIE